MEENHPSGGDCLSPISRHASAAAIRNRTSIEFGAFRNSYFPRQRYGVTTQQSAPGTSDQKQPVPEFTSRNPAADDRSDRGREHCHDSGNCRCNACVRGRNKMNTAANTVGIQRSPANPAPRETNKHRETTACSTPDRCQSENAIAAVKSQRIESIRVTSRSVEWR